MLIIKQNSTVKNKISNHTLYAYIKINVIRDRPYVFLVYITYLGKKGMTVTPKWISHKNGMGNGRLQP